MKIIFQNRSVYRKDTFHDPYIRGFLRNLFLRFSCHSCPYANTNRISDITLADFWGYYPTDEENYDDDKGISMVMINTKNGSNLFAKAKESLNCWERNISEAVDGNPSLNKPFHPSNKRELFWKDYHHLSFEELIEKYMYSEDIPKWFLKRDKEIKKHKQQMRIKKFFGYKNYRRIKKVKKRIKKEN